MTLKQSLISSDIFMHISNWRYMPRWGVMLVDLLLCMIAFIIAMLLGSSMFDYNMWNVALSLWQQSLLLLGIQAVSFGIFHTYSGIIRFSTFVDILKILFSLLLTTCVLFIFNLAVTKTTGTQFFLNTALLIYLGTAFVLLFGFRVGVKTIYDDLLLLGNHHHRVMIYGTKAAGLAIAKMLRSSGSNSEYLPIGFITDGSDVNHYSIQGLKVYIKNDNLPNILHQLNVQDVIISPLKMKEINPSTDLEIFLKNNIRILTTPSFSTWSKDTFDAQQIGRIENIQIEDLLERPTIQINTDNVYQILNNQVVMITGAAGSIGSELARQIIKFNPSLIIFLEQAESPLHDLYLDIKNTYPTANILPIIGDIRNREQLQTVFAEYKPTVVFHAAAYKHVPLMEHYPNEAIRANVLGTQNIADLSVEYGVKRFVMISTDKAVNPTNVMGASKRIAEIYVQSLFKKMQQSNPDCTKFITTRFGNVLGSNGSVIPYFKKQIAAGGPVTVTHPDIIRFFMTIPEACTLVLEAATLGNGGEIFVFDMGQPVRILDLARNMIRLAGYQPDRDIQITFTGLRPGEKLYEEVLNQKETTLPTSNDKIMIARVRESDFDTVQQDIATLIQFAIENKTMNAVQQMKHMVPEFKSKNSIYEQLD